MDRTLEIVQSLYEKKLTTYPRTDARVLSSAIAKEIVTNIKGLSGYDAMKGYVDEILENGWYQGTEKTKYTDDSKITDHYAIIPTGDVGALSELKYDEKAVYEVITRRFLSIFIRQRYMKNMNLKCLRVQNISLLQIKCLQILVI